MLGNKNKQKDQSKYSSKKLLWSCGLACAGVVAYSWYQYSQYTDQYTVTAQTNFSGEAVVAANQSDSQSLAAAAGHAFNAVAALGAAAYHALVPRPPVHYNRHERHRFSNKERVKFAASTIDVTEAPQQEKMHKLDFSKASKTEKYMEQHATGVIKMEDNQDVLFTFLSEDSRTHGSGALLAVEKIGDRFGTPQVVYSDIRAEGVSVEDEEHKHAVVAPEKKLTCGFRGKKGHEYVLVRIKDASENQKLTRLFELLNENGNSPEKLEVGFYDKANENLLDASKVTEKSVIALRYRDPETKQLVYTEDPIAGNIQFSIPQLNKGKIFFTSDKAPHSDEMESVLKSLQKDPDGAAHPYGKSGQEEFLVQIADNEHNNPNVNIVVHAGKNTTRAHMKDKEVGPDPKEVSSSQVAEGRRAHPINLR